jgi:hypothetical protein
MSEQIFTVTGFTYEDDGTAYPIRAQDTTASSKTLATVRAFATYTQDVNQGLIANFFLYVDNGVVWHTEPITGLNEAITFVRDDERNSNPDFSAREAVNHARYILTMDNLDEGDAKAFEAYRRVLLATKAELDEAFRARS